MPPAKIFGIAILLFGLIMAGDPRSFGVKTSMTGVIVAAAGMFLLLFAFYGATDGGNHGGSGRRVRDHSI